MEELITVMIPAYNAEKYIARCVESLCMQTYKNIEILIVNDGSKDSTGTICLELEKKDARVRLVNQENGGEGAARNTGLREAKGRYLCFVDADDYVKPEFVELLYGNLKKHEAGLSICGFTELKEATVLNETKGKKQLLSQEQAMEMLLREDAFKGYVWNKIFDMNIIRKYQLQFDVTLAVWTDVLFVFQYMCHIEQVVFDPTPVYYYIYLETSVSHGANHVVAVDKSYSAIRAQEQMITDIPKEYEGVQKQMAVRFVQNALAVIRNIGYSGDSKKYKEYLVNCQRYIKMYKSMAKDRLSSKERVLVFLSGNMVQILFYLYKRNA